MSTTQFQGWAGLAANACEGHMNFQSFEPKAWDEDDVDVKVLYCGICGSDASALSGEWGPVDAVAPQICGHEIVGEVVKVGKEVENGLEIGMVVGIGAQSDSCRECEACKTGEEQFCLTTTISFNAPYNRGNAASASSVSRGGFAKYWRGPSRFAIPIPAGLDPGDAAPMLCAGVTVFTPLDYYGAGSEKCKNVGVIGIGGLGHFAVLFSKAMGATVTAISRSEDKKEDAGKLGADKYIAVGRDVKEGVKGHEYTQDLIICTINPSELPIADYMTLLRNHGTLVLVGVTPTPLSLPVFSVIRGNVSLAGSNIGSPATIKKMLAFAAEKNVKPWIQRWDMERINKALPAFREGKPRFRFVLVNRDNGGVME